MFTQFLHKSKIGFYTGGLSDVTLPQLHVNPVEIKIYCLLFLAKRRTPASTSYNRQNSLTYSNYSTSSTSLLRNNRNNRHKQFNKEYKEELYKRYHEEGRVAAAYAIMPTASRTRHAYGMSPLCYHTASLLFGALHRIDYAAKELSHQCLIEGEDVCQSPPSGAE